MSEHIGVLLKEKRLEKGITASKLAKQLGVTVGYISRIENGSSVPSDSLLIKFSTILNIPINRLITNDISFIYDLSNQDWVLDGYKFSEEERKMWLNTLRAFIQSKEH